MREREVLVDFERCDLIWRGRWEFQELGRGPNGQIQTLRF